MTGLVTTCYLNSLPPAASLPYPSKTVRMVVPWPGGGLVDVAARQLATRLQAALGHPVVVDNKVGAGGAIGADQVAKSAADGHTLLFSTSALTMGVAMKAKTAFDLQRDFEPVCVMAHAPSVLVVGPGIQPASVPELVALAKARPGRLSYGSAGVGSPAHFAGELFKSLAGVDMTHVPYKGVGMEGGGEGAGMGKNMSVNDSVNHFYSVMNTRIPKSEWQCDVM